MMVRNAHFYMEKLKARFRHWFIFEVERGQVVELLFFLQRWREKGGDKMTHARSHCKPVPDHSLELIRTPPHSLRYRKYSRERGSSSNIKETLS